MPPLVLALIDSVFSLALHHHQRATDLRMGDYESASVRAELSGPEQGEPAPGGLTLGVVATLIPRGGGEPSEQRVRVFVDLEEQRLLAMDLSLAELPLDRSGLARLIGELEAWCYARIPIAADDDKTDVR